MALYIQTNTSAINGQKNLTHANKALDTTYQRLSSGLRINTAKDDAAGLQISNRLTSQINGLKQGNRNANDGIALCQTMEGALEETTNMLQRIRTLAIQAANGTNTTIDRRSIQDEITALSLEITRIACKTTFAGRTILNGVPAPNSMLDEKGRCTFQIGAYAFDTLSVSVSTGFTLSGLCTLAGKLGNVNPADPSITDHANNTTAGIIKTGSHFEFSCATQDAAQFTIAAVDALINAVDTKRAEFGALENRMESTIRNQETTGENVSDARSRIRDADYAEEASNLSAQNIIQQASTTVLTQANSRPQIALSLLGG
ncbi:MAG: flagellin [Succinivibrio sp.]|nr:flagellin [Succinivibrio sp.]